MIIRIEDIQDNHHIVSVKIYCTHDWATYWINKIYCTGIPRHIDRSNMHWRAHRRDVMNCNMHGVGHGPTYCKHNTYCWTRQKYNGFINTYCSNSHELYRSGNMYCSLKSVYIEAFNNMHCEITAQNIEWKVSYSPRCGKLYKERKFGPTVGKILLFSHT